MQFCGRAYYNLLLWNPEVREGREVLPWQYDDYRALSTGELFARLGALGVEIAEEEFVQWVAEASAPEDLLVHIAEEKDAVYLLFFELWRRLCPDQPSLSIFCDELDNVIYAYHCGEVEPAALQVTMAELERVLDDNSDHGVDPREVFLTVACNMAHDIEAFLFEFIGLQIDNCNEAYASELIEDFYPYVQRDHWFDFLRVRLTALLDGEGASFMLSHLLGKLEEKEDKKILFDVLEFLVHFGEKGSYLDAFTMLSNLVTTPEECRELIAITESCFDAFSLKKDLLEKMAKRVQKCKTISEKDLQELRSITSTGLNSV